MKRWGAHFLVAVVFAWIVMSSAEFAEPDSYYHLRYADLLSRGAIPRGEFPWASASTWATRFADKDWLFHVALVPFVRLAPDLFGGKLATIVFAGGLLAAATLLLKSRGAAPVFAALAVFSSRLFLERVVVLRTLTPAVALFVLLLHALLGRRTWLAFVVAVLYPLTYTAAHAPLLLVGAVAAGLWLKGESLGWKPAAAVFVGSALGVLLHPDFPRNVELAWEQNVLVLAHAWSGTRLGLEQANEFRAFPAGYVVWTSGPLVAGLAVLAGLVRLADEKVAAWQGPAIALGLLLVAAVARLAGVLDSPSTRALLVFGAPLWVLLAVLLVVSLRRSSLRADSAVLLILVAVASVAAALSARFFEYLAPLAAIALGLVVRDVAGSERLGAIARRRAALVAVAIPLLAGSAETFRTEWWLAQGAPPSPYREIAVQLHLRARPGEVVFHSRWDAFPPLFFFAPEQRYLVALDPAFLWLADSDHSGYDRWDGINRGTRSPREWGARFIVTDASLERFSGLGVKLRTEAAAGRARRLCVSGPVELWELL